MASLAYLVEGAQRIESIEAEEEAESLFTN
jgi:hypothetical protein